MTHEEYVTAVELWKKQPPEKHNKEATVVKSAALDTEDSATIVLPGLSADPAKDHYELGVALLKQGRFQQAIEKYDLAIKESKSQDPIFVSAHVKRAEAYCIAYESTKDEKYLINAIRASCIIIFNQHGSDEAKYASDQLITLLEKLKKEIILAAIMKITPNERKISILKKCVDPADPELGVKFWKPRMGTKCSLDKGTLKIINTYLLNNPLLQPKPSQQGIYGKSTSTKDNKSAAEADKQSYVKQNRG